MSFQCFPSLCKRPITRIIFFRFPLIVRTPIHELRQEKIPHVFEGVLLREEISARSDGCDGIQRQCLIVHNNALHGLVDDGKDLTIHHHLGKGPDAAAMQEPHPQQHIRHDNACHEGGQAVFNPGLPVRFLCAGGK